MRQVISPFVNYFLSIVFNHIYVKSTDSSCDKSDVDYDFMVIMHKGK